MTEREAFKAAAIAVGYNIQQGDAPSFLHRLEPMAWKLWQAACAWQREQDAKVCDGIELREWHAYQGRNVSAETRYKVGSNYWHGFSDGAGNCAGAIRAQGER